MARGRLISRSLSTSRRFGALPALAGKLGEFCQVLYPLIVVHCDDFGRMSGDAWTIKMEVHPSSPRKLSEFEQALSHLESAGLIMRYDDGRGGQCLQVADFEEHQPGLHKRTSSKFPEPPGNSRNFPEIPSELNRREGKGTEPKGTEGTVKGSEGASGAAHPPPAPQPGTQHPPPVSGPVRSFPSRRNPHAGHAACGRVCVPADLHDELRRKLGGDEEEADTRLRHWYLETGAAWQEKPIGDDDYRFWRARFAEWQGLTEKPTKPKPTSAAELARQVQARLAARGEIA